MSTQLYTPQAIEMKMSTRRGLAFSFYHVLYYVFSRDSFLAIWKKNLLGSIIPFDLLLYLIRSNQLKNKPAFQKESIRKRGVPSRLGN